MKKSTILPLVRPISARPYRDVSVVRVTRGPMKGTYRLPRHPRQGNYRDAAMSNAPVWSIGQSLRDLPGAPKGAFFAARDDRFYMNPDFECVWLR